MGPDPIDDPLDAWTSIGSVHPVSLDRVDLWLVQLHFRHPVMTARGAHRSRPVALVRLGGRVGDRPVEGWGECAALADDTFDSEDVAGSLATLEERLVPALLGETARAGGRVPSPSRLEGVRRAAPSAPLAYSALEMAVADLHLRAEDRSLAEVLSVQSGSVAMGAVVGRIEPVGALVEEVVHLREQGFSRVKLKIGPGWDTEPLEAVNRALPGLQLQADANGTYSREDIDHLTGLDRLGLLCLEQPFDRSDLEAHRLLARRIATPLCLDESIGSPDSARRALATGACSVICIKPARLGGLGATLDLVRSCTDSRTPLWLGGMFESGFARGVNATVAALPGFVWPGDLSPARTYLETDLVGPPDLFRDGPGAAGALSVRLPPGPGMGPPPDRGVLGSLGVLRRTFEVATAGHSDDTWPR